MSEILVVDAEHPDESPAGEPCDAFYLAAQADPMSGVRSVIGNLPAYEAGIGPDGKYQRQLDTNFVWARPRKHGNREEQRRYYLETEVYPNFDLIVARHGSRQADSEYAFCISGADNIVWEAVAFLGLRRVIHTERRTEDYIPPAKYMGIDLSLATKHLVVAGLQEYLTLFAKGQRPGYSVGPDSFERYIELRDLTIQEADDLDLPDTWEPFTPMGKQLARKLGFPDKALFVAGSRALYAATGYYGQAAVPLEYAG